MAGKSAIAEKRRRPVDSLRVDNTRALNLAHPAGQPAPGEWLGRHPRWTFHFTPTSASWLNAVEGFFATSPGVVSSAAFSRASSIYRAPSTASSSTTTQQSKPFVWTADPNKIIAASARGHQVLESIR